MSASIQIKVNPNIYLRDPQETPLGKNIIKQGILLMDEIGLERFTFKKLGERIPCTEAPSIAILKTNTLCYSISFLGIGSGCALELILTA